ncbi:MFS transporter [Brucella endophytica]|nr:MFS transporter [Brucella endophytica]
MPDEQFPIPAVDVSQVDEKWWRTEVDYPTGEKVGTVIVDTPNRYLYHIRPNGRAVRYGVGVGRDGFAWAGRGHIAYKRKWPRWNPPDEMVGRQPKLEPYSIANGGMPPGLNNPLGSRALNIHEGNRDTTHEISMLFYLAGFLLGAGWGLTFTIGPIMLSGLVTDVNRAVLFSVLSAFNALGMGLAPVAARGLLGAGVPHPVIFAGAMVLAVASAVLFYAAGRRLSHIAAPQRWSLPGGEAEAWRRIARSPAKYPLIMVFLGACVFSSMVNFQTTFAASKELNYSIFYISYTAAVIGARFLVSGFVNRKEPMKTTIVLLMLMCVSLVMFAVMSASPVPYAASSMLLGLSYGLVYPLIQAQAVSASEESLRSRTLVYFSLCYFIGVFGFPLLGGGVLSSKADIKRCYTPC